MLDHTEANVVLQKTRELCQAILDQPELTSARQSVAAFMDDAKSRSQYEAVLAKGHELQQKQQVGATLAQEEISGFESARDQLLSNPVARGFLDAQEQMREVHQTVTAYVGKTMELGRLPTPDDFHHESCGEGCSCEH